MAIGDDVLTTLPAESLPAISDRIQDGDILLCAATDMGSRLISWATRSPWTHVALAYRWPSLGRLMAFESVHTLGVRAAPLSMFIKRTSSGVTPYPGKIILARHRDFQNHLAADPGAMRRLGDFAVDRFGDPFASGEVLKIAARILFGRTRLRTPAALAPDDEFICSEYVAKCLEQVGIRIPWDGRGFIAPGDFASAPEVEAIARFQT
ncbi:MAG TPA: hypothetical protein VGN38_07500 [Caulobacteraceae bacterium]|jgi:hypothetical protein|nr:hypothetical protein [Caulobacteraceae bacterium]